MSFCPCYPSGDPHTVQACYPHFSHPFLGHLVPSPGLPVFFFSSIRFLSATRVRASTKISTPVVQTGLQVDQPSTNQEQRASSKFKSRSTNQPRFDQAREQQRFKVLRQQAFTELHWGQLFASAFVITGTLKPPTVSSGYLTGQANKGSCIQNLSSSKRQKCTQLQTASGDEV